MSNTQKIPDFILLREERKENGALKAYIDELEYTIDKMKKRSSEENIKIKKGEFYKELKHHNTVLQKKYRELKVKYARLQHELILLKNK